MLFLIPPMPGTNPPLCGSLSEHQHNQYIRARFVTPLDIVLPPLEACALFWAHLGYNNCIITRKIQSPYYFWVPAKTSKDIGIWPDSHLCSHPFIPLLFPFILSGDANGNQALGHYKSTEYIKTWGMVTGGLGNQGCESVICFFVHTSQSVILQILSKQHLRQAFLSTQVCISDLKFIRRLLSFNVTLLHILFNLNSLLYTSKISKPGVYPHKGFHLYMLCLTLYCSFSKPWIHRCDWTPGMS